MISEIIYNKIQFPTPAFNTEREILVDMATTNVGCPYCGAETRVTVPQDETIDQLGTDQRYSGFNITAGCSECGKRFGIKTS